MKELAFHALTVIKHFLNQTLYQGVSQNTYLSSCNIKMVLDGGVWQGWECFKLNVYFLHVKFNFYYLFSFHWNKAELGIPAFLCNYFNTSLQLLITLSTHGSLRVLFLGIDPIHRVQCSFHNPPWLAFLYFFFPNSTSRTF